MRTLCKVALTLTAAALLAAPALAQRPMGGMGQGGVGMLLANKSVQEELKIDKDQADKIKEATDKVRETHKDDLAKLRNRDTPMEERAQILKTVNDDTTKALDGILKPDQTKRLKQIQLQTRGAEAFTEADVQKDLKLTDDQKEKIKTISEDSRKEMREIFQGAQGNFQEAQKKIQGLRKETMDKVSAVLTADQKTAWKGMTGEPFELKIEPRRPNNN